MLGSKCQSGSSKSTRRAARNVKVIDIEWWNDLTPRVYFPSFYSWVSDILPEMSPPSLLHLLFICFFFVFFISFLYLSCCSCCFLQKVQSSVVSNRIGTKCSSSQYVSIDGDGFSICRHTFKMVAMTSFHAKKVLPPGEWTQSTCLEPMQQRSAIAPDL